MAIAPIKFRRNTAANAASSNPLLDAGEPGFETDTGKFKIGDGSTAWNDLPYAGGGSGDVHAGTATLASGEATVLADWVATDTVINALPQAAPSTPGTIIYSDPADIVDATSFKIKSDDATDSRDVYWIATPQTDAPSVPTLPDTFYVEFRARFKTGEDEFGGQFGMFAFNASNDFAGSAAFDLEMVNQGSGPFYDCLAFDFWSATSNNYVEYAGLTIDADTWYTFDLKFELSPDHLTQTVTLKLDGTPLGSANVSTTPIAWDPLSFILGGFNSGDLSGSVSQLNREFDYFCIGTNEGDCDLFEADFLTAHVPPFDSTAGTVTHLAGLMHVEDASASSYALKTL
jgi:hypothetical protein